MPAETYEGRPCPRCGGVVRYRDRNCVECYRRRSRDPAFRARNNEAQRKHYYRLSGYEYNRLLLKHRRQKALQRMAKRNQEAIGGPIQT